MHKFFSVLGLAVAAVAPIAAQTPATERPDWRARVTETLPLLGHRNWILIVDSAYPLQAAPGIETIETGSGQLEVLRHVLHELDRSIHVRPVITMDSELPYVSDNEAPGVAAYRTEIADLLRAHPLDSAPHERILATIEEASKHFNILVLKTNMTIPYTSVFVRLDCKYWGADEEKRLRAHMAAAAH